MEREKIMAALSKVREEIFGEYHTLMTLATELLHDGEDAAHKTIARRAQSKMHMLDGIQLAAEALGISWDELQKKASHEEAQS